MNPAVELTNPMKLVGGFEKNNLQIFDELVLLVAKMLSCGDAKIGRGGGGYRIKMTGPSGCRISRQFFVKTTTSATTLRYFVSILEDSLSSKICQIILKLY